ncbi:MAG: DNRLRE domain-containing protein [Bacteroidia bacterium]|nr:DNRLRE domain-containing protein [Bacteroidia bacterium]
MKTNILKAAVGIIAIMGLSCSLAAQTDSVLIFRPGSGLNDGSDQGGLDAGKDTYTYQDRPGENNGNSVSILAFPPSNCNYTQAFGYIQFDLSSLPEIVDSVFAGFTHSPHTHYCYSNCTADFYFSLINQAWSETELTFNNSPALDTAFYGPIPISFPNDFGLREYNITEVYKRWKNEEIPNFGFAMLSNSLGCNNVAAMFAVYSSDDTLVSNRPYLKIYYKNNSAGMVNNIRTKLDFSVFPNPSTGNITVQATENLHHCNVIVTDVLGREVLKKDFANTAKFDMNIQAAPGMYFLKIQSGQYTKTAIMQFE